MNRKNLAALVLLSGLALSSVVRADDVPSDRETSFRQVTGPSTENVPGGALMLAAYGVIWLLLGGYVFRMGRAQRALEADVKGLEKRVASLTRTGG